MNYQNVEVTTPSNDDGVDVIAEIARDTIQAALAPITLIDGNKLIDLLIEHSIGIRKRTVELLEVDPTAFADEGVGE